MLCCLACIHLHLQTPGAFSGLLMRLECICNWGFTTSGGADSCLPSRYWLLGLNFGPQDEFLTAPLCQYCRIDLAAPLQRYKVYHKPAISMLTIFGHINIVM